ncbi:MAG: hypothetical protein LUD00_12070 [Prevotellaceae bacterium]|nr:hypothetical protein [Prevotellaceae bacterium]
MITRDIKRTLKKIAPLRELGWWLEVNVISQIEKQHDIYLINKEAKDRERGKKPSKNDAALIALKNSKKGESCIIVGNGPSLRISDLEAIYKSGMDSFGLNKINQLYDKTSWRPTYMVVHDHRFLISGESTMDIEKYIGEIQDEKTRIVFLRRQIGKCFPPELNKKILYFRMPLKNAHQIDPTPIKGDISLQLEDLGLVTSAAIEIAMYMGYTSIYLYGQDFKYDRYIDIDGNYVDSKESEAYAEGIQNKAEKYKKDYHDLRKAFRGFRECKIYAESHGVSIFNATRGGNLEVFPREAFENVFK